MANEEQLALLKQGVEVWNAWKNKNPNADIDFSGADLGRVDLRGADFIRVNLSRVDLRGADLIKVNFSRADLSEANLSRANLSGADLSRATLISTNLNAANLGQANLSKASLISANLSETNLILANLSKANLVVANLSKANLLEANLSGAELFEAKLVEAELFGTNLRSARLIAANLRSAKLIEADLSNANLHISQVFNANFTHATLTGACIAQCHIGDSTILNEVKCDYVFRAISPNGEFIDRCPLNRKFEPGEFTKLVQIHKNTVELIFRKGINWSAFAHAFNETNTKVFDASGQELYLKKYEVLDDGLIRLEVTVPPGSDKQFIHDDLEGGHEKIARLEGMVQAKNEMLEQVLRMLKPGDIYMNSSKYDQRGAQFAGGFAETVNGNQIGGIINNYGQNTDDILRLLTSLRDLSQSFPDEQKEKAQMALDGLEADLNKPEKPSPKRLGQWLKMLILAGTAAATFVEGAATFSGNVHEFTDNTSKLIETLGLSREDIQPTP